MACYTFFHPSWRKGSHASKEDNNNNLDEKKYSKQKKSHSLNSYFTKLCKRDGGEEPKEKEKKGKGMQQCTLHDWENFHVEKKEKATKSIWQWVESINLNINQFIFCTSRWINLWSLFAWFHHLSIWIFVIHKNKKMLHLNWWTPNLRDEK